MHPRSCLWLLQLGAIIALGAASALLVDHWGITPAYCHGEGGCAVARQAAARWFGPVPLPLVALGGFAVVLAFSLAIRRKIVRRMLLLSTATGGLAGAAFLLLQALVLRQFCPLCVVVDVLAVAVAIAALYWWLGLGFRADFEPAFRPIGVVGLALIGTLTPAIYPHFRAAAEVPVELRAVQHAGKVTVVEFVDLECPHCRALFPVLQSLEEESGTTLGFHRYHVPFASHVHARGAARLLHCVSDPSRRQRLETKLFSLAALDEATLRAVAESEGIGAAQLDACLGDPEMEAKVQRDVALFRSLGRTGLPTVIVGGERITGAMPKGVYRVAIDRVRRSPSQARTRLLSFLGVMTALTLAVVFIGRNPNARA
ncbi:MAG: DsbA family protein [Polyangiaceae bacterium]